ncbi:MAG: hypothetical protein ABIO86_21540 [Sphingomonas sp.]
MPIFLLPGLAATLLKLSSRLADWDRLARIEEQLLRRARSAFLVHWFGTGVPEQNLNLLIHIDNIDELRERYRLVDRSRQRHDSRLNLFAPLAGMVGVVAGIIFNPTGGTLAATAVRAGFDLFSRGGLVWITLEVLYRLVVDHAIAPGLFGFVGLVALVVAPVLLAVGLSAGLGGNPAVVAIYDLLGDAAMLADAFLRFWRQITGPVDQIRNPLVRAVMRLLHRIAALIIQVAGFVSLLVVRLVPILPWLVAQYRAAMDLGRTVVDIAGQITAGIVEAVKAPFLANGGILAILRWVFDHIMLLPVTLMEIISRTMTDATTMLSSLFTSVSDRIQVFIDGVRTGIVSLFNHTPVGELYARIQTLLTLMPQVRLAFETIGPPPPAPTPAPRPAWYARAASAVWGGIKWVGTEAVDAAYLGGILDQIDAVRGAIGRISFPAAPSVTIPAIPTLPKLPDTAAIDASIGVPAAMDLGAARDALMADARARAADAPLPPELLRTPPSAFRRERSMLDIIGDPVVSPREAQLRDMIYAAVGRVLPPALRIHAPEVRALFDQIDEHVYGGPEAPDPPTEFPELELEDSGRLSTQVQLLTIHSNGGAAPDLRAFQSMLVDALQRQTYYAADAAR